MNKKEFITAVAGYVDKYASAYGILVHSSVLYVLYNNYIYNVYKDGKYRLEGET